MGKQQEIQLPDIGDFESVDVIELLVKPGDRVAAEQSLLVLESDKATMEIPSPVAGVVAKLLVGVGDKVSQGSPIAVVEVEEATASAVAEGDGARSEAKSAEPSEAQKDARKPPQAARSEAKPSEVQSCHPSSSTS